MLEFVIKVCYHKISILCEIRAKMQHNASRMSLSDLVISALGPTALVLISLDQKNSFSRHSAASMHSSSPSMLISANNTLFLGIRRLANITLIGIVFICTALK